MLDWNTFRMKELLSVELEDIWADKHDEGLPFSTAVNEALVLEALKKIAVAGQLDNTLVVRVKQWITFNQWINEHEDEPYRTWVEAIYSQISALML